MIKRYSLIFSLTFGCLILVSQLHASTYMTIASGNESASTTWGLVDPTSEQDSEVNNNQVPNVSISWSSTFTISAVTVNSIATKFTARAAAPSGTVTVYIAYSTMAVNTGIVATSTMNVSDIAYANALNSAWCNFVLSKTFAGDGSTGYVFGLKSSAAAQVNAFTNGTSFNWSRELRTTTQGTPTTGDKLLIIGENTAAGAGNNFTVTWDSTTAVLFGSTGTANMQQSIVIGNRAIVNSGTSAGTSYKMMTAGIMFIGGGGTMNIGTFATSLPTTSTFTLTFSGIANVDTGLQVGNDGTFNTFGSTKTPWVFQSIDSTATARSITVSGDISNWISGDIITIASSDRTFGHTDLMQIQNISGQVITTTGPITNFHSGTNSTQAEVQNLTRNILIQGSSSTVQGYIFLNATSSATITNTEIKLLGSATANKRGIDVGTAGSANDIGSCVISSCSIHDFFVTSSVGLNVSGAAFNNNLNVNWNNIYNIASTSLSMGGTTATQYQITDNTFANLSAVSDVIMTATTGSFQRNSIYSSGAGGVTTNTATLFTGIRGGNIIHSNAGVGENIASLSNLLMNNNTYYFNSNDALDLEQTRGVWKINNSFFLGNLNNQIDFAVVIVANGMAGEVDFNNDNFSSSTTFTTTTVCQLRNSTSQLFFDNCNFGFPRAHTNTFNSATAGTLSRVVVRNSLVLDPTFAANQANLSTGSYIAVQRFNRVNGDNRKYSPEGLIQTDSAIVFSSTPSIRMTPIVSSQTAQILSTDYPSRSWQVAVASNTSGTVSVSVRNSVAGDAGGAVYNGAPPKLWVHKNTSIGINADTVLATYAGTDGNWTTLNGTAPIPNDNGIEEFYVTNSGTTGWTNVSDFKPNFTTSPPGVTYWIDGASFANTNNSSGGGTVAYPFVQ